MSGINPDDESDDAHNGNNNDYDDHRDNGNDEYNGEELHLNQVQNPDPFNVPNLDPNQEQGPIPNPNQDPDLDPEPDLGEAPIADDHPVMELGLDQWIQGKDIERKEDKPDSLV